MEPSAPLQLIMSILTVMNIVLILYIFVELGTIRRAIRRIQKGDLK